MILCIDFGRLKKTKQKKSNLFLQPLSLKTQNISSSMVTEDIVQCKQAAALLVDAVSRLPTDRKIHIELQYKIDIY